MIFLFLNEKFIFFRKIFNYKNISFLFLNLHRKPETINFKVYLNQRNSFLIKSNHFIWNILVSIVTCICLNNYIEKKDNNSLFL